MEIMFNKPSPEPILRKWHFAALEIYIFFLAFYIRLCFLKLNCFKQIIIKFAFFLKSWQVNLFKFELNNNIHTEVCIMFYSIITF